MIDDRIFAEAVAWLAGEDRANFDWDAFTCWLEADPANRAAYDAAALLDDAVDRHRNLIGELAEPANDNRRAWLGWVGGIASLAAVASLFLLIPVGEKQGPTVGPASIFLTSASERRTVSLPHGVVVTLAPNSRLHVAGDHLTIDGEGYFAVAHDPARRLLVTAGTLQISDIGTTFSAEAAGGKARVAIAEGSLTVSANGRSLDLSAGAAASMGVNGLEVSVVDPASVGDWSDGSLIFDNAPLSLVAAQLSRYSGDRVSVDPLVADRRFSGVVAIGETARPGEAVAAVMGIGARRDGGNVRLGPDR